MALKAPPDQWQHKTPNMPIVCAQAINQLQESVGGQDDVFNIWMVHPYASAADEIVEFVQSSLDPFNIPMCIEGLS